MATSLPIPAPNLIARLAAARRLLIGPCINSNAGRTSQVRVGNQIAGDKTGLVHHRYAKEIIT